MGRTIGVVSGKGGTGKTTLSAALGSCLSALNKTVVCVDADIGSRNLDISLGISEDYTSALDLADALAGVPVDEILRVHPKLPNLSIIPAPLYLNENEIAQDKFSALINSLKARFDFVITDSSAGLSHGFSLVTKACEELIVVATLDKSGARIAARAAEMIPPEKKSYLVANRVKPKLIHEGYGLNIDELMNLTGLKLLGYIPEDDMIPAALHINTPLVLASGNGAIKSVLYIAKRLLGEQVPLERIKQWRINQ